MPKLKLTDAQAETIAEIQSWYGLTGTFAPLDIYPGRTNRDNGGRRTITGLVKKGLIEKVPCGPHDWPPPAIIEGNNYYRLRLVKQALDEFTQYAVAHNWEFPWE